MKLSKIKSTLANGVLALSVLPMVALANDPSKLLPTEIKDKNAFDIVEFIIQNAGMLIAAFIIIVSLVVGGSSVLDGLKEYNRDRDVKKLMGHLFSVAIVVVMALLMGYGADSYIQARFKSA